MEETRNELKARKKAYKKAKKKAVRPWSVMACLSAPLAILMTVVTVLLSMFDNTATLFLGGTFWELVNADPNAIYFSSDFKTDAERIEAGKELVKQVEAEGAALLKNDNAALPLATGAKVSLFSTSSVNIVYGGTGSANVDASKCDNLKEAMEKAGFVVNPTLWDFYETGDAAIYNRGTADATVQDSAQAQVGKDENELESSWGSAEIIEAPWSIYTDEVKNSVTNYGDAAIVVLSRIGGEGADAYFDTTLGNGRNYLALNHHEKDMMAGIKAMKDAGQIKKIIVLINTSNALQVDFLKNNEYGVDAAMWIGGVGATGINAVAEILAGQINPSGSLVDTYMYDNYSTPAMQNFVKTYYKGNLSLIPGNADTYMIYQEGIYVGYKYFETRYEDYVMGTGNAGNFAYNDKVAFPFGYGLSYTNFEYSNMSVVYDGKEADTFTATVTVTNTGDKAGKETVQIYVSSPYTEYDIKNKVEKASVSLVGFEKTGMLEPGASQTLTIKIDADYVASYDAYGAGTYIMDAGDYLFTAATDSHNAVNNVLAAKGYTVENTNGRMDVDGNAALVGTWNNPTLDTTTYAVSDNGTKIENQLNASDPNMNDGVEDIVYLTRNDWTGTMPDVSKRIQFELNDYLVNALKDVLYQADPNTTVQMPTLGANNGLKLYDLIGKDFNDPAWEKLLDQMTFAEMISLVGDSFHWTMPIESVQAPGTRDENGPQGLTVKLFGAGLGVETTALTSEDVLAATFNKELVYAIGNIVGNDCLAAKVTFLYGPGANTHRTPYGGRNFEYYSEDGVLASEIGRYEVKGIEDKGVLVVMKHFALNDSEQDRIGQGAWLNEQSAREIYLRAFQGALESSQAGGNGIMTAYTRWGTSWSGEYAGLMRGILKGEWGCNGLQITDNILPGANYTDAVDAIMGGVTTFDAMMSAIMITNVYPKYEKDPVVVSAMREACHHNLYAIANSQAMNGMGPDTTVKALTPSIIVTLTTVSVVLWLVFAAGLVMWILRRVAFKKNYVMIPATTEVVEETPVEEVPTEE